MANTSGRRTKMARLASDVTADINAAIIERDNRLKMDAQKRKLEQDYQLRLQQNQALNAQVNNIWADIQSSPVEDYNSKYESIPDELKEYFPTPDQFGQLPDVAAYYTEKTAIDDTWENVRASPVEDYDSIYANLPENLKDNFPTPDVFRQIPDVDAYYTEKGRIAGLNNQMADAWDQIQSAPVEDYGSIYNSLSPDIKGSFPTPEQYKELPEVKQYYNELEKTEKINTEIKNLESRFDNIQPEQYAGIYNALPSDYKQYFPTPEKYKENPDVSAYYKEVENVIKINAEIDRLATGFDNVTYEEYESKYNALPAEYKQYFPTVEQFKLTNDARAYIGNVGEIGNAVTINRRIEDLAKDFDNATITNYESKYNALPAEYKQYFPTPEQFKAKPDVVHYYTGVNSDAEINNNINKYQSQLESIPVSQYESAYNSLPTYYKQFFQTPTDFKSNNLGAVKYYTEVSSMEATNREVDKWAETLRNVTAEQYMLKYLNIPEAYRKYFQTPEQFKSSPQVVRYYADQEKIRVSTQYNSISNILKGMSTTDYAAAYNTIPADMKKYFYTPTQFNQRPEVAAYNTAIANNPVLLQQYESYVAKFKATPINKYTDMYNSLPSQWKPYFKTPAVFNAEATMAANEYYNSLSWYNKLKYNIGSIMGLQIGVANWLGGSPQATIGTSPTAFTTGLGQGFYAGQYGSGQILGTATRKLGEIVSTIGNATGQAIGLPLGIVNSFWGGTHTDINTTGITNPFVSGIKTGFYAGQAGAPPLIGSIGGVGANILNIPTALANSFFISGKDYNPNIGTPNITNLQQGLYAGLYGAGTAISKIGGITYNALGEAIKLPISIIGGVKNKPSPLIGIGTDLFSTTKKSLKDIPGITLGLASGLVGPANFTGDMIIPTNRLGSGFIAGQSSIPAGANLYSYSGIPGRISDVVTKKLNVIPFLAKQRGGEEVGLSFQKGGTGIYNPLTGGFESRIEFKSNKPIYTYAGLAGKAAEVGTYLIPYVGESFMISQGLVPQFDKTATAKDKWMGAGMAGLGVFGLRSTTKYVDITSGLKAGPQTKFKAWELYDDAISKSRIQSTTKIGSKTYRGYSGQVAIDAGIPGFTKGMSRGFTIEGTRSIVPFRTQVGRYISKTAGKIGSKIRPYTDIAFDITPSMRSSFSKGIGKFKTGISKPINELQYIKNSLRQYGTIPRTKIKSLVLKSSKKLSEAKNFWSLGAKGSVNKAIDKSAKYIDNALDISPKLRGRINEKIKFNIMEGKVPAKVPKISEPGFGDMIKTEIRRRSRVQPYQDVFVSKYGGTAKVSKKGIRKLYGEDEAILKYNILDTGKRELRSSTLTSKRYLKGKEVPTILSRNAGQGVYTKSRIKNTYEKGYTKSDSIGGFKRTLKEGEFKYIGGDKPVALRNSLRINDEGLLMPTKFKTRPNIRGTVQRVSTTGEKLGGTGGEWITIQSRPKVIKEIVETPVEAAMDTLSLSRQNALKNYPSLKEIRTTGGEAPPVLVNNIGSAGNQMTQTIKQEVVQATRMAEPMRVESQELIAGEVAAQRASAIAQATAEAQTARVTGQTIRGVGSVSSIGSSGYVSGSMGGFQLEQQGQFGGTQQMQYTPQSTQLQMPGSRFSTEGYQVEQRMAPRLSNQQMRLLSREEMQLSRLEDRQLLRFNQPQLGRLEIKQEQISRLEPKQEMVSRVDVEQVSRLKQEPISRVMSAQVSRLKLDQVSRLKQAQASRLRAPQVNVRIKTPRLRVPPIIWGSTGRQTTKKAIPIRSPSGFDVQIKRKGQWIGSGLSLTESQAGRLAQIKLKQSLAASARLVPTKKRLQKSNIQFIGRPGEFRQYKVSRGKKIFDPRLFIQEIGSRKQGFSRLGSRSEVSEIQRSKRGRIKW